MIKTLLNKALIIVLLLFFSVSELKSQYKLEWSGGFGGDRQDEARCVIESKDRNLFLAGFVNLEQTHVWLLKTDFEGNKIWGKTYENSFASGANSIINTSDNNLILVGFIYRKKSDKYTDALVLKTDLKGKIIWRKTFGGKYNDAFNDIVQTDDGGFFLAGYTEDEIEQEKMFWTVKLNKNGEFEYENGFSETSEDVANAVIKTNDGNFVAAGYGIYSGKKIYRIIKLNENCEYIWDTSLDYKPLSEIADLIETNDGNLILAGTVKNPITDDFDVLFLKYSADGDSLLSKQTGYAAYNEQATSLTKTYDGALFVSGFRKGEGTMDSDFLSFKTDFNFNIIWEEIIKRKSLDYCYSCCELSDNGVVVAGSTYMFELGTDFAVAKYTDLNKTGAKFINPPEFENVSEKNILDLEICISGYDFPETSDIIVNGFLQVHNAFDKSVISTSTCKYPLYKQILLDPGKNEIEIVVRDKRGFYAQARTIVYYVPPQGINW